MSLYEMAKNLTFIDKLGYLIVVIHNFANEKI